MCLQTLTSTSQIFGVCFDKVMEVPSSFTSIIIQTGSLPYDGTNKE